MTTQNTAPSFFNRTGFLNKDIAGRHDYAVGSIQLNSGEIIVFGSTEDSSKKTDLAFVKLDANGYVATDFGTNGAITYDIQGNGSNDFISQGAKTSDNGFIVVGSTTTTQGNTGVLIKIKSDGSLDNSFGDGGKVIFDPSLHIGYIKSICELQGGNILVIGENNTDSTLLLMTYKQDGTLDESYDTDGMTSIDVPGGRDYPVDLKISSNGDVFILAGSRDNSGLSKYNIIKVLADGSIDTSFGVGGTATIQMGNYDFPQKLLITENNKIIAVGYSYNGSNYVFSVVKLTEAGALDTSFGNNGQVMIDRPTIGMDDYCYTAAFTDTDKIILAGSSYAGGGDKFSYVVLNNNGSIDQDVGYEGGWAIDASGQNRPSSVSSIVTLNDGKVLLIGSAQIVASNYSTDFSVVRLTTNLENDSNFGGVGNISSLNNAIRYTEDATPVNLAYSATIYDGELGQMANGSGNYSGSTLTLSRHGGICGDDIFGFSTNVTTSGWNIKIADSTIGSITTWGAGQISIQFNTNATQSIVNTVLNSLTYKNQSNSPDSNVVIDLVFSDENTGIQGAGGKLNATAATTIQITSINDVPKSVDKIIITAEDTPYTFSGSDFEFHDPDVGSTFTQLKLVDYTARDGGIYFSGKSVQPGVVIAATDIGQLSFESAKDDYGDGYAIVHFQVSDGLTWSETYALTFNVTPVRDDMIIAGDSDDNLYIGDAIDSGSYDYLYGFDGNDSLYGGQGNDTLDGGKGNDLLNGGQGADIMIGGSGNDTYYIDNTSDKIVESNPSDGIDTIISSLSGNYSIGENLENLRITSKTKGGGIGNTSNNTIYAGIANNYIDGGSGVDTVDYKYSTNAVTINLSISTTQNTLGSGSDTLKSIENINGTNYADTLFGNTGANRLGGESGNDTLSGGSGNDTLIGGIGRDYLSGGSGKDIFDFNSITEFGISKTSCDVIKDFVSGVDKIDLSTIDANPMLDGNQAFAFTSVLTSTPGQVCYKQGYVYINMDTDSDAEYLIQLIGSYPSGLLKTDFIL